MINKKTLVILSPGFAKDESDSTCLPMQQQLVKALKENNPGLNIIILSFQYPYLTKRYNWFGIPVIPFNGKNKGGIQRLLLRIKLASVLKNIHKETPVSCILSFWYGECAAVGKRFAAKHGLPHFCWILGQDAKPKNSYPKRTRLLSHELIAVSDATSSEFEKNHGIKPQYVITPGIDPRLFNMSLKPKSIDILGVGSLIPIKQYEIFVELLSEVKKNLPDVKAMLIGKGPEKEKLEKLVTKWDLHSNLVMTGELPYQDVIDKMQRSKVFLHPSSAEGFSGVCLEALYAGAHVISFCKPMNQEIEQLHIVSSKDEMQLATLKILQEPATVYKPVMFCDINESAKKMIELLIKSR